MITCRCILQCNKAAFEICSTAADNTQVCMKLSHNIINLVTNVPPPISGSYATERLGQLVSDVYYATGECNYRFHL